MTNEQREAIETCKEKIIEPFYNFPNPISIELKDTDVGAIETILSLIKEQQKEIENITTNYKNLIDNVSGIAKELGLEEDGTIDEIYVKIKEKDKELKNKDKVIDLIAEQLAGLTIWNNEKDEPLILGDKEDVKQYFERKVEDVK